jgi:hypothetical protein
MYQRIPAQTTGFSLLSARRAGAALRGEMFCCKHLERKAPIIQIRARDFQQRCHSDPPAKGRGLSAGRLMGGAAREDAPAAAV